MHQAFGGPAGRGTSEANAGYAVSIGGQTVIIGQTMSMEEFARALEAAPDSFIAQLQLGIAESERRRISEEYSDLVRQQAGVIGQLNRLAFAYEEVAPGLRRTSIVAGGAIGSVPAGRFNLSVNRAAGIAAGLQNEQIDLLLSAQLTRNAQTDRISDWSRELQFVV